MTAIVPVHATYTGGDSDGLAEYQATETIQVTTGIVLDAAATISIGTEGNWGWKSIYKEIVVKGIGVNNPLWTQIRDGLYGHAFLGTGLTECWATIIIPKDYATGTSIYFKTNITNSTSTPSTNPFRIQWEYSIALDDDREALGASATIGTTRACSETRYMMMECLSPEVASASLEAESIVKIRMFRNAAHTDDTNTNTLILSVIGIYYQANKLFLDEQY